MLFFTKNHTAEGLIVDLGQSFVHAPFLVPNVEAPATLTSVRSLGGRLRLALDCLLYTSDAADDM
eukprot:8340217-Alexandrium_andersonii.AAC.1